MATILTDNNFFYQHFLNDCFSI